MLKAQLVGRRKGNLIWISRLSRKLEWNDILDCNFGQIRNVTIGETAHEKMRCSHLD
jgi:hypothetical protein